MGQAPTEPVPLCHLKTQLNPRKLPAILPQTALRLRHQAPHLDPEINPLHFRNLFNSGNRQRLRPARFGHETLELRRGELDQPLHEAAADRPPARRLPGLHAPPTSNRD